MKIIAGGALQTAPVLDLSLSCQVCVCVQRGRRQHLQFCTQHLLYFLFKKAIRLRTKKVAQDVIRLLSREWWGMSNWITSLWLGIKLKDSRHWHCSVKTRWNLCQPDNKDSLVLWHSHSLRHGGHAPSPLYTLQIQHQGFCSHTRVWVQFAWRKTSSKWREPKSSTSSNSKKNQMTLVAKANMWDSTLCRQIYHVSFLFSFVEASVRLALGSNQPADCYN